jgi:hypothetical protein
MDPEADATMSFKSSFLGFPEQATSPLSLNFS